MGICPKRYFMLSICVLQIVTVTQRQVFDFLGFLWIPILINFFDVIFIIFGFFGAFQYRPKYIIAYSLWNLFWLGWNIFLICLYLDIGSLNHKESKILKIDPDSSSWWENGPGCKGTLNMTSVIPVWDDVTNCLVDYRYVEVLQAGIQCVLAVLGVSSGYCLSRLFMEEDDSFNYLGGDGKSPEHLALQPMYVSCN
ncbi:sodium/potassium-transporting ATPase subunit beta-1-interacting protein-like, partial [Agrilus planipennis]|uniref:Sodium/potassium-transporting ATPase subunit beta-1-interacting protein n=1 Tax=Agrilus planipennis TaxID=224129 RepID=A0A1W4XFX3_AGRPL